MDLSVSSSAWGLGRAAVYDCGTLWTFLLPFFFFFFFFFFVHLNVCLDYILIRFKYGYVESKPSSLGQISFKPCMKLKDHNYALIFLLLHQNVCPDYILVIFENGLCVVKN